MRPVWVTEKPEDGMMVGMLAKLLGMVQSVVDGENMEVDREFRGL